MKKKLIFFLYIGDERTPQERISAGLVAKVHFYCLKRYAKLFDEAKFVLSINENIISNTNLAPMWVGFLMGLGYRENVEFVVEKNTSFRESKTFKEEIVDNRSNDGKLVFFAHLRGETNDNEQVARWVFSNYYYGLNIEWELNYWLVENLKPFYGFPLTDCRHAKYLPHEVFPLNKFYFLGSIFWVNVTMLREIMRTRGIDTPPLANRYYSENFPGNVVNYELAATARYVAATTGWDCYSQFDGLLAEWCERSGESVEEFNVEYEKIKSEVF